MKAFDHVTKIHNELKTMSAKDLKELAKKLGLKGISKANKDTLLDKLEEKLENTAAEIDKLEAKVEENVVEAAEKKLNADKIIEDVKKANEAAAESAANDLVDAVMDDVKNLPEQVANEDKKKVFIGNNPATGEKMYRLI